MFKNLIEKIKLYLAKFKNPDKPRNQWEHLLGFWIVATDFGSE